MCTNSCRLSIGCAMLVALAVSAPADFVLDWHTIDAGGSMRTAGGDFELSGTIGQPDAGGMTGGDYALAGGFWPGVSSESEPCFGDLNGDLTIDLADLAQLLGSYGTTSGATYADGDLNGDGAVDLSDLAALLGVYGTSCP